MKTRARCRHCGDEFQVRQDGRVPFHKRREGKQSFPGLNGPYCYGSAVKPRGPDWLWDGTQWTRPPDPPRSGTFTLMAIR